MPAYKDDIRGTWYCSFYYTDWTGHKKIKKKRGFSTKREALAWERDFLEVKQGDVDMTFGNFWELYKQDMNVRLRESTMMTKAYIVELKILPYFKDKQLNDIKVTDVREWQNMLINQGYKETYLKTINNQLNAIFNYAVKYYELKSNPCSRAGSMGKSKADEMKFWTKEEFETFVNGVKDKQQSYVAFMVLFWTGMRVGELLALNYGCIDFDNNKIRIKHTYQRIKGKDVFTPPKTPNSIRTITIPDFLTEMLKNYVNKLYGISSKDRIFNVSKNYLEHEIIRGCKNTGIKKIRIHDIRHSHVSFLINLGTPVLEIKERLGHNKIETTLGTYGHLYPNKQAELAQKLNTIFYGEEQE